MDITPDSQIYFQLGFLKFNATIVNSWIVIAFLFLLVAPLSWKVKVEGGKISKVQHALEVIIEYMRGQIREVMGDRPFTYLPFLATLFLFLFVSNLFSFIPYFVPPSASLSTTAALAFLTFLAVFFFGIKKKGVKNYFKQYLEPTPFILPFKLMGEVTRTFALAVRLFGNMMSSNLIVLIIVSVVPLFVPILMQLLGLLIGTIQAYIFTVLAAIYIGSGTRLQHQKGENNG